MKYVKPEVKYEQYRNWRDYNIPEKDYRFLRDYKSYESSKGYISATEKFFGVVYKTIEEIPDQIPIKKPINYYTNENGREVVETISKTYFDFVEKEEQVVTNGLRYM